MCLRHAAMSAACRRGGSGDVAGVVAHFLPRESCGDQVAVLLGQLALAELTGDRIRRDTILQVATSGHNPKVAA